MANSQGTQRKGVRMTLLWQMAQNQPDQKQKTNNKKSENKNLKMCRRAYNDGKMSWA